MRSAMVRLSLFVSLLTVLSPGLVVAAPPRNVVLIAWDGAARARVDRALAQKELPNLQKLIGRGVYVRIDVEGAGNGDTAWTQLLAGYLPRQPAAGADQPPVPKGATVFDRLENHFGADKFVTLALIAGQRAAPAMRPGVADVWADGLPRDETVGARAVELLDKYKDRPFFLFVHLARDAAGPASGTNPPQNGEPLVWFDRWTGQIADKVQALGLADKTQFYVTAGLNYRRGQAEGAPPLFLATDNRAVCRDGRRQDVAPTILEAFGLDLGKIEPALDGISLTKIDTRPPAVPNRKPDVVYVPTPMVVVDKMLELAQVKPSDVVYDLGCGDGRIVVTAAKRFGCKAYGYDIDPQRVAESLENVRKEGVGHLVTIEQKDIFTLDLSGADVVTLYLLPSLNVKLIPQLDKLKAGSRIVSHDFDMRGVKPDQVVQVTSDGVYISHTVYLWTCPLNKVDEPDEDSDDGVD